MYFVEKLMSVHFKLTFAKGTKPTTEVGLVSALVEHVTGAAPTQKEMAELMAFRLKAPPEDASEGLVLDDDNLALVKEMVEAADVPEILQLEEAHKKKARRQKPSAEAQGSSSGSAGPLEVAVAPAREPKHKVGLSGAVTPEWAKTLVPQVMGCTLNEDTVRHHRWVCTYPRPPPCHVSKAWTHTGLTRVGALVHVLHVVWGWHGDATGATCPFQFEEEVAQQT